MANVRYLRMLPKDEALSIGRTSFAQAVGYVPTSEMRRRCNHIALSQLAVWLDAAEALDG